MGAAFVPVVGVPWLSLAETPAERPQPRIQRRALLASPINLVLRQSARGAGNVGGDPERAQLLWIIHRRRLVAERTVYRGEAKQQLRPVERATSRDAALPCTTLFVDDEFAAERDPVTVRQSSDCTRELAAGLNA